MTIPEINQPSPSHNTCPAVKEKNLLIILPILYCILLHTTKIK
jgi:hypothetical protein